MSSFVDVDGARIRVVAYGLTERNVGEPILVFENGGSVPLNTWDPLVERVARIAPIITYDRPGTGESPWDSLPPTPDRANARLQALLMKLGASPPYVLVGHSWGGALVRYYAGNYPDQVAGLLYIDPTDITQIPADELTVFESIGADRAARDAFYRIMDQALVNAPAEIRAEAAVITTLMRSDLNDRKIGPAPDVPTSVIIAGQLPRFPRGSLPFDADAYAKSIQDGRRTRLQAWIRPGGSFIEAANAGHFVHVDEPDLVVDAIRTLLRQIH